MSKPRPTDPQPFNLTSQQPAASGRPEPETPFRMAIFGDFSGRANRDEKQPGATPQRLEPMAVDCDNLDAVMNRLVVELSLPVGGLDGQRVQVRFSELEDFHPDRIYQRLEHFRSMRDTRRQLLDPTTFDSAAAEVRSWGVLPDASAARRAKTGPTGDATTANPKSHHDDFVQLLNKPAVLPPTPAPKHRVAPVTALLKRAVSPSATQVAVADPRLNELVKAVDAATSQRMRAILHHPAFQALESAWRSLDFLVRHLETDEQLKLYLVDVSKDELAQDLASVDNLASTGLHQLLFEQAAGAVGGQPWAMAIGNYTFQPTPGDIEMLGRIARIAQHAGAPFVAGADPQFAGCPCLAKSPDTTDWLDMAGPSAEAWQTVRSLKSAAFVGLALPRVLLRLPYGRCTDAIDTFDFQEVDSTPAHDTYLWGNPAFVCGYLLGQAYSQHGWGFTPGADLEIEDLPAHTYKLDDESIMTPCAEAWLSDTAAQKLSDTGCTPLLSVRGRDAVRLSRLQSIADPATHLAGRWG